MYEKLESMMEVIISEKKERKVEREARRIEREERKAESEKRKVERLERRERMEKSDKSVSVDDRSPSVPDALAKICTLPHFDPLHLVFIFDCGLMEDPQKRMILFVLPNDESRFLWLAYLYEEQRKK